MTSSSLSDSSISPGTSRIERRATSPRKRRPLEHRYREYRCGRRAVHRNGTSHLQDCGSCNDESGNAYLPNCGGMALMMVMTCQNTLEVIPHVCPMILAKMLCPVDVACRVCPVTVTTRSSFLHSRSSSVAPSTTHRSLCPAARVPHSE